MALFKIVEICIHEFYMGLPYVRDRMFFNGDWRIASKPVVAWWR